MSFPRPASTDGRKDQRFSPPAVSLPKGGGAIKGIGEKFGTNPATGTGSLTIPLPLSPGRSGFTPDLTLSYDSGAGNGPFGFGWSIGVPSISRRTDRGIPRYLDNDESDVYILSGAEDLVPVLDPDGTRFEARREGYRITRYRPRIEGLFARIERWASLTDPADTYWRSISRDNVTTVYGRSAASRIADPADPARIFTWLLCESFDDKGNAAAYEYVAEDGRNVDTSLASEHNRTDATRSANRYLKRVKYANRTSRLIEPDLAHVDWLLELVMDYGDHEGERPGIGPTTSWPVRPDPFSTYRAGFEVRTYRRCRRVLMFHRFEELGPAPMLVRALALDYDDFAYADGSDTRAELEHAGSTGFGSFLRRATVTGYAGDGTGKSMPPLELTYSRPHVSEDVRTLDDGSLANLPAGADGVLYRWLDLDSEGLSGVLTEQGGAWWYKPNLGGGRLGPQRLVAQTPSVGLSGGVQLLDLAGDGSLDLVQLDGPTAGLFEREDGTGWAPFRSFASQPNVDWGDPNLRLADLTGDGHADVLITEDDVIAWHPSLAEAGFGPRRALKMAPEESLGPRLLLHDTTGTVFLADMSGDGLADLVRVRNGEVCYWPSLGYGRFGPKVTMDGAPVLDSPEHFEPGRIRLADIDGSGVVDIVYLAGDGVRLYFNRSGNGWSTAYRLASFPPIDNVAGVDVTDLMGNGTACLVWSTPLPNETRAPLHYVDLMGNRKPHLLVGVENNMGARTRLEYTSSTRFYLEDRLAGRPWITRLPFPVHVVHRVETYDAVSRSRFVTRFAYHHGDFDGVEREFRGFGMVERWDTEEFAALASDQELSPADNVDASSHVPPVLTRTWFHTGVHVGRDHVSDFFAGLTDEEDTGEYYREPGSTDEQARRLLLDDTVLLPGLSAGEEREACRALKGTMLRQEVYALDGTGRAPHPYSVTEQNFTVRLVQARGDNLHAVFFSHPRESIGYHYERNPADPRVAHDLTLEVDDFGNVLKAARVAYGRREPDPALDARDQAQQAATHVVHTETRVTNAVATADEHRTPLPCESRTYEVTGLAPPAGRARVALDDLASAAAGAAEIAYEERPTPGALQKRLIEHVRTLYRRNDLGGPLPLGSMESRAIPFESYKLAFTPGLRAAVYGAKVTDAMLAGDGGYVHGEGDGGWWVPSGRVFHSPGVADEPPAELAHAQRHFFLPRRHRDPFGETTFVDYEPYDLLVAETRDALGNTITVGERDASGNLIASGNDYRVLQPRLVTDANGNRAAVAFDALGLVVGTAVMGKRGETPRRGDLLDGFVADLPDEVVVTHLADPLADPHAILGRATTRLVYDLFAYHRTKGDPRPAPMVVYTLVRETHDADLAPGRQAAVQHSFSYSDGFGREIQKKAQAEPGPVVDGGLPVDPRWVGSGWTIFDNKGQQVRRFEPFFTSTHRFESDVRVGVSPFLLYDPVGRVVATLHPDHSWQKVRFDPWRQETWDPDDTVLVADPRTDPDVGGFFRRLGEAEYLPTWYAQRQAGGLGPDEQAAAAKTEVHAGTPSVTHTDSLGRTFLTVAHNRFRRHDAPPGEPPVEEFYATRVVFDVEGNQREVIDAEDRVVARCDYDLLGNPIRQASMEAGERWALPDAAGTALYVWDSRGHRFRTEYDALRRPTDVFLREGAGPERLIQRTVYGETRPAPEVRNQRGKPVQVLDQAGVLTTEDYDFKGNPLTSRRQLAREYRTTLDWSAEVPLDPEVYASRGEFDALDRPTSVTTPDGSVYRPTFNEANLLEKVDVHLRGAQAATPFVTSVDYDARGRRARIEYGNGVRTECAYDPSTFRLRTLETTRSADQARLQSLTYTYDPAGNIARIRDGARQTIYFGNQVVTPDNDYTYDAVHRLIRAEGREHVGQASEPQTTWHDRFRVRLAHPNDGQAMRRYTERYEYDAAGNFTRAVHRAAGGDWTRAYAYDEPSLLEPGKSSNRLTHTAVGGAAPVPEPYAYDAHGNMTAMPHLSLVQWDHRDQLRATSRQVVTDGSPETTWYVYDAAGQRVRKVTERRDDARKHERIYLDRFEVYREFGDDGAGVTLERETLHVLDGRQRRVMVETRTLGDDGSPQRAIRYQLGNHVGSVSLELDGAGQVLSYEEYYPYGSTSYQAVHAQSVTPKRYRYTGMERDEESGLAYHTARYYLPWIGRWSAADPAGLVGGLNGYAYAANPVRLTDRNGRSPSQDAGDIGELILEQWLDHNGFEYFPDVGKRGNEGGIDKVAYDPKTDYVYYIDNKALASGSISDASALSIERLGVENLDNARKVLEKHTGYSERALAALEKGRVHFVLSNAYANFDVKFSAALFAKGWKALDIVTGGLYSDVRQFNAARAAFAGSRSGRAGVARRAGQRGFATVGGMTFLAVSIGGTVYAITQIRSLDDALQFAGSSAAGAGAFTIGKLVTGSTGVGIVVGGLLTMSSDQGEPSEERKRRSAVRLFLGTHFKPEQLKDNYEELARQAEEFLFHTEPLIVPKREPCDGGMYGGQTFGGFAVCTAVEDSRR